MVNWRFAHHVCPIRLFISRCGRCKSKTSVSFSPMSGWAPPWRDLLAAHLLTDRFRAGLKQSDDPFFIVDLPSAAGCNAKRGFERTAHCEPACFVSILFLFCLKNSIFFGTRSAGCEAR